MSTIHHLNSATMCPYNARLMDGEGGWTEPAHLVAHVLVIETDQGLVLIDTGLGRDDVANPKRTGAIFRYGIRPKYILAETVIEQLKSRGLDPADVRHVAVTHLDVDHAGGLSDFPAAKVHVFKTELDAALNPGIREKLRYIKAQWAHGPDWNPLETSGDEWFGFEAVRVIEGVDPEILIIPMAGHSRGHSAIAVKNGDRWLLHCGDAYFHRREIETPPAGPVGLRAFQAGIAFNNGARRSNQERLRELAAIHGGSGGEIELFCAHDVVEFERLSAG